MKHSESHSKDSKDRSYRTRRNSCTTRQPISSSDAVNMTGSSSCGTTRWRSFRSESSYDALRKAAKDTQAWTKERAWALEVLLTRQPQAWVSALLGEGEIDLA